MDRNSEQTESFLPVKVEPGLDSLNKNPEDFTCMPEEDNTPPDRYSKYSRIVKYGHSEISNKWKFCGAPWKIHDKSLILVKKILAVTNN